MKVYLKVIIFLISSSQAFANIETIWSGGLNKADYQASSFCYVSEDGSVKGSQIDKLVKIASVSKILSSLYFLDYYKNPKHQFITKVFYIPSEKRLHIAGDNDPFFTAERLLKIIAKLNSEYSHLEVKTLSFDNNFHFFADTGISENIENAFGFNEKETKKYLNYFFLSDFHNKEFKINLEWTRSSDKKMLLPTKSEIIKRSYHFYKDKFEAKFQLTINDLIVDSVEFVSTEFNTNSQLLFTSSSPYLINILKYMNSKSDNYIADTLFSSLDKVKPFNLWLSPFVKKYFQNVLDDRKTHSSLSEKSLSNYQTELEKNNDNLNVQMVAKIYTGSGLMKYKYNESKQQYDRYENRMSCGFNIFVMQELKQILNSFDYKMSDLLLSPNDKKGTLKNRLQFADSSLVAKTGTINKAIALAGYIDSRSNPRYFGLFHNSTEVFSGNKKNSSRRLQDSIVEKIYRSAN